VISDSEVHSRIVTREPTKQTLILASASPRRHRILRGLGISFEVVDSGLDEELFSGSSPEETATLLATNKAESAAGRHSTGIVLAADTVIGFRGHHLGKPVDNPHASEMLRQLRGFTHEVITGISVLDLESGRQISTAVSTRVTMRKYGEVEIEEYIGSGEPFGKAGAYAIQGLGSSLISSYEGCYNNIVGLPLCETVVLLSKVGFELTGAKERCRLPSGEPCPRIGRKIQE